MNKSRAYLMVALLLGQLQACAQTTMKIIYIMDPQCGWCYGNSDNITALQEEFKDDFEANLRRGKQYRKPYKLSI